MPSDLTGLRVADLQVWLDTRETGIDFSLPRCHTKFMTTGSPNGDLVLYIKDGTLSKTSRWKPLYYPSDTWQLWLDEIGCYVFIAPELNSPRWSVLVDAGFSKGEVISELAPGVNNRVLQYPLQNLDMVFFANWLANSGDLFLHASGIEINGRGYCFAGSSGAGKSTLVADLAATPGVTILGEDNLALRYLEGRFWIFGTPWHLNPDMCSPRGAPLEKLFFLDRTLVPGVEGCSRSEGISRLLHTAFIPYYRIDAIPGILDNLGHLAGKVPFHLLSYQRGSDVLKLILDS